MFLLFTTGHLVLFFFCKILHTARYCYGKPPVRPSVCNVVGLRSHMLEFFENISRLVNLGSSHIRFQST